MARARLNRRSLIASTAAAAATPLLAPDTPASTQAEDGPFQGMNVPLFMTDQQRATQYFPDGWEEEHLPGLRRLKERGVSFEHATCNACMCSPSRASLMTGLFPAQHGVKYCLEANMPAPQYPQVELSTELVHIGTVMAAAGYATPYSHIKESGIAANRPPSTPRRRRSHPAPRTRGGSPKTSTSTAFSAGTRRTPGPTNSSARPAAARSTTTVGS